MLIDSSSRFIVKKALALNRKSYTYRVICQTFKNKTEVKVEKAKVVEVKITGTSCLTIMRAFLTLLLYMGISMRLKHVCARGNTFTFLSPKIVNLRIFPSLP